MIKFKKAFKAITLLLMGFLFASSFYSCSVLDKVEPTPSYLYVDRFTVTTSADNSQGSSASEIVDGWVYVGGTLIGTFELPAMVPVIFEGGNTVQQITVLPGIKNNGISNQRVVYPLLRGYIDSLILVPGKIDTIKPTTTYQSTAKFAWLEDFEDRSISLEKSGINVTEDSIQLVTDPSEVFPYTKNLISAKVSLDPGLQYFENSSISKFDLPRNSAVYLEVHYKLDVSMQVGFYVFNTAGETIDQVPILVLYPTDGEWKKTYISFAEDVNTSRFNGGLFKVFFAARGTDSTKNSKIYLDNIKLIHF